VFLSFDGKDLAEPHPFTINNHRTDSDLRFSIKALGDHTSRLQTELNDGAMVKVEGPYGCFDYRKGKWRQLWLAGGIGVTPFLSFLPDVDDEHEVTLIWSVNEAVDAFYHEEIEALTGDAPNITYHRHVVGSEGYLKLSKSQVGVSAQECSVYICGPAAMRDSFVSQLVSLRVPPNSIFFEEFST